MSEVRLRSLLAELPTDDLVSCLGVGRVAQLSDLLGGELGNEALATALIALEGEEMLGQERVRRLLFEQLPEGMLTEWARQFGARVFEKSADTALSLASLPWRHGSSFPLAVIEFLGLGEEHLPKSGAGDDAILTVKPCVTRPPLRDYQREVADRLIEALRRREAATLVQMPTGAGKTRTVMDAVLDTALEWRVFADGGAVVWVSHVEELCDQAVDAFEAAWREKATGLGIVVKLWGGFRPNADDCRGAFVVATYQKLAAAQRSHSGLLERLAKWTQVVVVDEAHKSVAPTFKAAVNELRGANASLVGLTATPGRALGADRQNAELASFFQRSLIAPDLGPNPIGELRRRGVLAKVRHISVESGESISLSRTDRGVAMTSDLPSSVLMRLGQSSRRNRRILDVIRGEVADGRSCLMFACSVDHSKTLAAALQLRGYAAAHLDATLSRTARRRVIEELRAGRLDVLTNFGVLSTGFDVPEVSTVIITRPTASVVLYSQMVGRGLRGPASGGSEECNLIDIRDNFESFGAVDDVYGAFEDYWSQ